MWKLWLQGSLLPGPWIRSKQTAQVASFSVSETSYQASLRAERESSEGLACSRARCTAMAADRLTSVATRCCRSDIGPLVPRRGLQLEPECAGALPLKVRWSTGSSQHPLLEELANEQGISVPAATSRTREGDYRCPEVSIRSFRDVLNEAPASCASSLHESTSCSERSNELSNANR